MTTFLEFNNVDAQEYLVDFLDLNLEKDLKLFINPLSIALDNSEVCKNARKAVSVFTQTLIQALCVGKKSNDYGEALNLLKNLREPKGTGIGYTVNSHHGKGAGETKAQKLLEALLESDAVMSGDIEDLEDFALTVDGVSLDTISDITINIARKAFCEYTLTQCRKYKIPTEYTKEKLPYFCHIEKVWKSQKFELPHCPVGAKKKSDYIILLPKRILEEKSDYNHRKIYTKLVSEDFKKMAITAGEAFVRLAKSGEPYVYKKDLRKHPKYRASKKNISAYIKAKPEVLRQFRELVTKWLLEKRKGKGD